MCRQAAAPAHATSSYTSKKAPNHQTTARPRSKVRETRASSSPSPKIPNQTHPHRTHARIGITDAVCTSRQPEKERNTRHRCRQPGRKRTRQSDELKLCRNLRSFSKKTRAKAGFQIWFFSSPVLEQRTRHQKNQAQSTRFSVINSQASRSGRSAFSLAPSCSASSCPCFPSRRSYRMSRDHHCQQSQSRADLLCPP